MGNRKERKVINAMANWQEVIDDLHNQLKNETWRPNDIHRIKIINDGIQAKKREIVYPDFLNEHIIYHAVIRKRSKTLPLSMRSVKIFTVANSKEQ